MKVCERDGKGQKKMTNVCDEGKANNNNIINRRNLNSLEQ